MRLASIDIGTNSVKLVVADVEDRQVNDVLFEQQLITRLGQGVDRTGELQAEAMDRNIAALGEFRHKADSLGVQKIIAIATSAMRDSINRDIFLKRASEEVGIEIQIASGDEEAELTFMGASTDSDLRSKKLILVDVGGGSSEFILGQNGIIEDRFSINTGCVRLTEEFLHSDPVETAELQSLFQKVISMFFTRLSGIPMDERELAGVGGTITTLAAVHQGMNEYQYEKLQGYVMQKEELVRVLTHLKRMPLEERKKVPGLPPQRADVIVAGAAIFSAIMEILKVGEIVISTRGLRYGALLKANL